MQEEDNLSDNEEMEEDILELKRRQNLKIKSTLVILPDSPVRAFWDIVLFIMIVYQSIVLPMRIAFEMQTTDFFFNLEFLIDLCFILDVPFNFNTGFYQKGQLIMRRDLIFKDYVSWWFWIDLVSSLPYTWILAWQQGITIRDIEADD